MTKIKTSPNEKTLIAYNNGIASYLEHTPAFYDESHRPLLKWINAALTLHDKEKPILEIGSGSGRDALYIQDRGYSITVSDAATSFVRHLSRLKLPTLKIDLLRDALPHGYGMIFANAVFPHFTYEETTVVLRKIHESLPSGGILAFSVKQGSGDTWTREKLMSKRYIHFWQPREIVELTTGMGFRLAYINANSPGDLKTHTWTHLVVVKE